MPISKAKVGSPKTDEMRSTLATLRRRGGPVEIKRRGKTVAVVMTPEQLEALEDEIDAALLREALANPSDEPRIPLADVAAELGVKLRNAQ